MFLSKNNSTWSIVHICLFTCAANMNLDFLCIRCVPQCWRWCRWFAWRVRWGWSQHIVLMCKYYASLLLHPRLSEPAWRIWARRTSKSSFSWSVLLSDMHSYSKNTCRCVPLHPPNVSVHESPPLPKNWLWTTVGVSHTECKNEIQTHSQGRHMWRCVWRWKQPPHMHVCLHM